MIHTLQTLAATLITGLSVHMEQWDGWAVLFAAALFGYRGATLWMPLVVALVINPIPYGLVANLMHGRLVSFNAGAMFTIDQIVIAYLGFAVGRLAARLR